MAKKSVVTEAQEIQLAIELINLGARLQLLESETSLSRERLLKLYKELKGVSPPKGMLPFSTDWFITWQPNIHSSLFINIHRYLIEHARISGIEAVMKAYKLYLEQVGYNDAGEPVLSLTRAWTLVRFFESKMLMTTPCCKCHGHFVVHRLDLHQDYLCGLCHMPSRAGKTKKAKDAVIMGLVEGAMPVAASAPLGTEPVLAAVAGAGTGMYLCLAAGEQQGGNGPGCSTKKE